MSNTLFPILYLLTLCILTYPSLYSQETLQRTGTVPKYPVEVSFLAVDLKYNEERGVQICEIQQGVPSTFRGEYFQYGENRNIAKNFMRVLNRYYEQSWAQLKAFADIAIRKKLKKSDHWILFHKFSSLKKDKEFIRRASLPVYDPTDLYSYHGFVIMDPVPYVDREALIRDYPGVVFIDNANYHLRRDKLSMSKLLKGHPLLVKHKPTWAVYEKEYSTALANEIINEIQSDKFVIKPIGKFHGMGVIIVSKENLDVTLKYILKVSKEKPPGYDNSYRDWISDQSEKFIVEEFVDSEPVSVPHLGSKLYSPTLRLVYFLIYDKEEIEVVSLGGYYSLPMKSISEKGTLNEKYKSYCQLPYYCKADPEVMKRAEKELSEVLLIVYKKMLGLE